MPSSNPAQTHDSPHQIDTQQTKPHQKSTQSPQNDSALDENQENSELVGEEEEESECGFCLFMKAGGCRDWFIEWEKCIEEGENNKEDIVEKCHSVTKTLKDCMEANPNHYGPILRAEKAAEEEAEREMENVELNSGPKVERKQSGLVEESLATIEVEEIPSSCGSKQKVVS